MLRRDFSDYALSAAGYVVRFGVYTMMIAPPVIVLSSSLTPGSLLQFPPDGVSFMWYVRVWQSLQFKSAIWTSTYLALLATAISLVLGFSAAFVVDRFTFGGRTIFQSLMLSPIVIPMVVLGLSLLQFLSSFGLAQTFLALLAGHVLITLPYVVRTLLTGLSLLNKVLEEAALNLGASPLRTLIRVTIPVLMPNLIAASVFAFVTSFGNVTLSVFLSGGRTVTLPVQIFTFVESSYDPTVAAVSGVVIMVTLMVILIAERVVGMSHVVGK